MGDGLFFILPLVKFPWDVLSFSKQLATLPLDTRKHWEARKLQHSPLPLHGMQLFLGVTSGQDVHALSKSSLWASKARALGHGEGEMLEVPDITLMAKLKAGFLIQRPVQLWRLLPAEAACESWHFAGTDSSPYGRLGLQWKVDSSTVPGM